MVFVDGCSYDFITVYVVLYMSAISKTSSVDD